MATTFSIGGVSFSATSTSDGRKALEISVDSRAYELKRFHPPGTSGNIIIRPQGPNGGKIRCLMRYIGTVSSADALFVSDKAAWENSAVTIVDDAGQSYTTCNLDPGSMRRVTPPRATGAGSGKVFFEAEAVFTRDGAT